MKDTIVEILIDKSGSMGFMKRIDSEGDYKIDGVTRMYLARKMLLENILPSLIGIDEVFLRTFRTRNEIINKQQVSIPEILPIFAGKFDSIQISKKILNISVPESGGTPITAALKVAEKNLLRFTGKDKKIILLTDGEENGDGNFIDTAKKILESLDNCKIFVIGFALDKDAEIKISTIATGGFYNVNAKEFSSIEVRKKLNILFEHFYSDTLAKLHQESERIQELISNDIDSTTLTIDEEYSSEICRLSEKLSYNFLQTKYPNYSIKWMNENGESFCSYDFEILDENGKIEKYVECKGTKQVKPTFYLTKKEWDFFLQNKKKFEIIRVSNLFTDPIFKIYDIYTSIFDGTLVPMLSKPEILKENRVFLTVKESYRD